MGIASDRLTLCTSADTSIQSWTLVFHTYHPVESMYHPSAVSSQVTERRSKANHHHHAVPIHMSYIPKICEVIVSKEPSVAPNTNTLRNLFEPTTQRRGKRTATLLGMELMHGNTWRKLPYQHLGAPHGQPVKTNNQSESSMVTLHMYSIAFTHQRQVKSETKRNKLLGIQYEHKTTLMLTNQSFNNFATSSFLLETIGNINDEEQ